MIVQIAYLIPGTDPVLEMRSMGGVCKCVGYRHLFTSLALIGLALCYIMRVSPGVAIIAMVHSEKSKSTTLENDTGSKFNWTSMEQNTILSSFFYSYLAMQVPSGWMVQRIGGKWTFAFGVCACGLVCLILPKLVELGGFAAFMLLRLSQGLFQGLCYPSVHRLAGNWFPPREYARLAGFMHSGYLVGTVLALLCSGYLIRTDALQGWPSTFYVSGILTLIWLPFWIIYVTETPHSHPWITAEEKHHIENSLRTTKDFNQRCLPWRKIFVSRQVWIVMACYVMDGWANYTLLVCVPQYMDKVLNFPLDQNGALSSMPYVFALIFIYLMSFVDAWLVGRGWISIPNARKLWSSIGAFGKSILLLVIGYMDTSCRVTIICLLVMNIMLSSATLLGFNLADLDLAPPYAGFLYSVFNACSTLSGVVAPLAVGGFTSIYTPVNAWRDVFILASAISCLCGVIYLLFGHAELLSWIIPLQQDIPEPSYEVISSMPQVCGEQLTISAISRPRGSSRCSAVRYKPILSGHEVEDDSNDEI